MKRVVGAGIEGGVLEQLADILFLKQCVGSSPPPICGLRYAENPAEDQASEQMDEKERGLPRSRPSLGRTTLLAVSYLKNTSWRSPGRTLRHRFDAERCIGRACPVNCIDGGWPVWPSSSRRKAQFVQRSMVVRPASRTVGGVQLGPARRGAPAPGEAGPQRPSRVTTPSRYRHGSAPRPAGTRRAGGQGGASAGRLQGSLSARVVRPSASVSQNNARGGSSARRS